MGEGNFYWWLLLTWDHWFNPTPGYPSFIYSLLTLLYAFGLGVCLAVYFWVAPRRFATHLLKRKVAETATWRGGWLSLGALVLLIARHAEIPFLSMRALTYLVVLATVIAFSYLFYYLKRRYPQESARYERQRRRSQRRPKKKI